MDFHEKTYTYIYLSRVPLAGVFTPRANERFNKYVAFPLFPLTPVHSYISAITEIITGRTQDTCPDGAGGNAKVNMGSAHMDIYRSEIGCEHIYYDSTELCICICGMKTPAPQVFRAPVVHRSVLLQCKS